MLYSAIEQVIHHLKQLTLFSEWNVLESVGTDSDPLGSLYQCTLLVGLNVRTMIVSFFHVQKLFSGKLQELTKAASLSMVEVDG